VCGETLSRGIDSELLNGATTSWEKARRSEVSGLGRRVQKGKGKGGGPSGG
jgi:hypothetical protein